MGTSLSRAGLGLGGGDDRLDQSRSGVATRRTARPSGPVPVPVPVERSCREVQWVDAARIDGGMRMCKNGHASGASVRFVGVCVVACGARGRAGASREARANADHSPELCATPGSARRVGSTTRSAITGTPDRNSDHSHISTVERTSVQTGLKRTVLEMKLRSRSASRIPRGAGSGWRGAAAGPSGRPRLRSPSRCPRVSALAIPIARSSLSWGFSFCRTSRTTSCDARPCAAAVTLRTPQQRACWANDVPEPMMNETRTRYSRHNNMA